MSRKRWLAIRPVHSGHVLSRLGSRSFTICPLRSRNWRSAAIWKRSGSRPRWPSYSPERKQGTRMLFDAFWKLNEAL